MAWKNIGNGAIFHREKAEGNKPQYGGPLTLNIDGREVKCEMAAWVKDKDGRKFFSVAVSTQELDTPAASQKKQDDGEIPF